MQEVKKAIDAQGHCLLEMPSGTGKTVSLLSLVVAYMRRFPDRLDKLVYCSRTIPEIEKCMEELRALYKFYERQTAGAPPFVAVAMSARKNLCINESVASLRQGSLVDGGCQRLTASFVRARRQFDPSIPACSFFETLNTQQQFSLPPGIYNLSDLKQLGRDRGICPYFVAREAIRKASIVVYSYHYILDPKIAELVSKDFSRRSEQERANDERLANPVLTRCDIMASLIVRHRMRSSQVLLESPAAFVKDIQDRMYIDRKPLRFCAERLDNLTRTLEVADGSDFDVEVVQSSSRADLGDARWTSRLGFSVIIEPSESNQPAQLTLSCMDASIAIRPVMERFQTVVITSGTLSPLEMYPKILDFDPAVMVLTMTLARPCLSPLVVARGNDQVNLCCFPEKSARSRHSGIVRLETCFTHIIFIQVAMTSRFEQRNDVAVIRNYGNLVLEMAAVVPDGMDRGIIHSLVATGQVIAVWYDQHVIDELMKSKLLFIETNDALETYIIHTSVALEQENDFLTFDAMRHTAQCMGRALRGKTDYGLMIFADKRTVALVGATRICVRGFHVKINAVNFLAGCKKYLETASTNLSIDEASAVGSTVGSLSWLTLMAQPFTKADQLGISLLTSDMLNPKNMKKFEKVVEHVD
ncbi:DNA repair helicase [Ostertagia ostertagi]